MGPAAGGRVPGRDVCSVAKPVLVPLDMAPSPSASTQALCVPAHAGRTLCDRPRPRGDAPGVTPAYPCAECDVDHPQRLSDAVVHLSGLLTREGLSPVLSGTPPLLGWEQPLKALGRLPRAGQGQGLAGS